MLFKSLAVLAVNLLSHALVIEDDMGAVPDDDDNKVVRRRNTNNFGVDEGAAEHSCTLSIERSIAGPYDYKSIIGSGKPFEDSYFTPNTDQQLRWNDFPRKDKNNLER